MLFADKDMLPLQSRAGNGEAGSMERGEERGEQTKVRVELMLPGFGVPGPARAFFPGSFSSLP